MTRQRLYQILAVAWTLVVFSLWFGALYGPALFAGARDASPAAECRRVVEATRQQVMEDLRRAGAPPAHVETIQREYDRMARDCASADQKEAT
jgi:hypothetical protein